MSLMTRILDGVEGTKAAWGRIRGRPDHAWVHPMIAFMAAVAREDAKRKTELERMRPEGFETNEAR